MIEIHRVTRDRWPELERLFEGRGKLRGCWCMIFRAGSDGKVPKAVGPERKHAMRGLVGAQSFGVSLAQCGLCSSRPGAVSVTPDNAMRADKGNLSRLLLAHEPRQIELFR